MLLLKCRMVLVQVIDNLKVTSKAKGCPFLLCENKEQKVKKAAVLSPDGQMERDGAFLGYGWQGFSAVLTTVM